MKAAVARAYGPPEVVSIAEWPDPVPGKDDLLVRVTAAAVTRGDARVRALDVPAGFGPLVRLSFGLTRPRKAVLGMEFAGRVERAAGAFSEGDRVFGSTGMALGAHAEKLVIPADGRVLPIPEGLTDTEAAAFFFGGLTAVDYLLEKGQLAARERVLVNGATGAVGIAAIQIARHHGARVTAVCSAANAAFAHDLGAEETIDYRAGPLAGQWDVILDLAGTLPWSRAEAHLVAGGRLLAVTAGLADLVGAMLRPRRSEDRRVVGGVTADTRPAMERLVGLYAAGAYRPFVGTDLPFTEIVEAHRLAGSGHKRGSVVVTMVA